jgi:hypothetical protein
LVEASERGLSEGGDPCIKLFVINILLSVPLSKGSGEGHAKLFCLNLAVCDGFSFWLPSLIIYYFI